MLPPKVGDGKVPLNVSNFNGALFLPWYQIGFFTLMIIVLESR
jgi:hypothetical protein